MVRHKVSPEYNHKDFINVSEDTEKRDDLLEVVGGIEGNQGRNGRLEGDGLADGAFRGEIESSDNDWDDSEPDQNSPEALGEVSSTRWRKSDSNKYTVL